MEHMRESMDEQGLAMGSTSPLSSFMKEDHATMALFMERWPPLLVQRVWVSSKALLGSLRGKLQQKVEAAAIEEAILLAGGLVSSLLDTAANQRKVRAPGEVISRTDLHAAAREMGVGVLLDLADIWMRESFGAARATVRGQ